MDPTRRLQAIGGLIVALLGGAVLTSRALILLGAVVLLAGVLLLQWQATSEFRTIQEQLAVEVAAAEHRTVPDGTLPVTISATVSEPVTTPIELVVAYGPGVAGPETTLTLDPGDTQTSTVHEVEFPVAGQFEIPEIHCHLQDSSNVVTESLEIDTNTTITVEPPAPTDVHIGQGGERLAGQYGEHQSTTTGSGIETAELRQYRPGDSVGQIDWKATARLNEPYVREFEAETARHVTMLVDARPQLWDGTRGRSKLAYLREVALGFVEMAEAAADPVSLSVIEAAGLRMQQTPTETAAQYRQLRWTLQNLTPEQGTTVQTSRSARRGPGEAGAIAQQLAARDSAFARTLQPYFAEPGSYIERLADDPLFEAVRRVTEERAQHTWMILFTDDTDPRRTVEAAKMAAKHEGAVTVFLTPSVLFSTAHSRPQHYDQYIEFEELRRELDSIPRVTAYEVAPGDRLESVLASGRSRSTRPMEADD